MAGLAIITEACLDVKDRACVDVCPVQCIYEFDPDKNLLWSEQQAGSGEIENTHAPDPEAITIFGDGILYVNLDECTSCTACYEIVLNDVISNFGSGSTGAEDDAEPQVDGAGVAFNGETGELNVAGRNENGSQPAVAGARDERLGAARQVAAIGEILIALENQTGLIGGDLFRIGAVSDVNGVARIGGSDRGANRGKQIRSQCQAACIYLIAATGGEDVGAGTAKRRCVIHVERGQ
jgi:ferredoxin